MGLPSKKQLHKHKRGTRKALDTLDAMDKGDEKTIDDSGLEDLIETKKSKKPEAESKNEVGAQNTKQSQESISPENVGNPEGKAEQGSESPADEVKESSTGAASGKNQEGKPKPEKKSINLDGLEEESFLGEESTEELKKPISEEQPLIVGATQEDSNTEIISDADASKEKAENATEDVKSDAVAAEEYDEDFEDTQKDKYLTFRIGDESFGFSITFITEIIVIHKITEVPDTPAFVRGVINLRGKVIPVIDVRHRFNMELREYDERTCIIVVEYEETFVGLIVDTVNEVADIPEDHIDPPPRTHSGIKSSYIMGMGKIGKEVIILLNLEKILFVDEILAKRRILEEG